MTRWQECKLGRTQAFLLITVKAAQARLHPSRPPCLLQQQACAFAVTSSHLQI